MRLAEIRQHFVRAGNCRNYVNSQTRNVIRIFRFAVARELIQSEQVAAFEALESLKYGEAPDNPPIDQFDLSGALNEMIAIIRQHRILLPSRVSLLIKMLVMFEGTSQQLSPDFNIVELLEPYRVEAVRSRLSP